MSCIILKYRSEIPILSMKLDFLLSIQCIQKGVAESKCCVLVPHLERRMEAVQSNHTLDKFTHSRVVQSERRCRIKCVLVTHGGSAEQ